MAVLAQGMVLLVAGMGIVFLFLILLVGVMSGSAKIIPRFNHILPDEAPKKRPAPAAAQDDGVMIAVAIAAAAARAR